MEKEMRSRTDKMEPRDQGQFTFDRPVRAFSHLHFRAKPCRLAAAKRNSCGARRSSVGYWRFLSTGAFLEGLASNWQAAVLQLGSLIVFSSFLFSAAPHSRDPRKRARRRRTYAAQS